MNDFEKGFAAASEGKGKDTCPYIEGTSAWYDWMDGYNDYIRTQSAR